nr:MAG TPA: hypothetical protein [Crassvirales sp.]
MIFSYFVNMSFIGDNSSELQSLLFSQPFVRQ